MQGSNGDSVEAAESEPGSILPGRLALSGWARGILAVLILAVTNYVAGRLALLLAVPPGFATAVFPPSGIALAAVVLWGRGIVPGVFLGSLAFNLELSLDASPDATLAGALPAAVSIATGSVLQALAGAWLLLRFADTPIRLVREDEVLRFVGIVCPIGCLIAATCGIATLALSGLIAEGTLAYTWFTWWVGDAIGVLVFTPVVLSLFANPRSVWRPRLVSVGIPLGIAFGLAATIYFVVSERAEHVVAERFRTQVDGLDRTLRRDLDAHAEVLWSIRSFFAGSQSVEEEEFHAFVQRPITAFPQLQALSWNPWIRGEQRSDFEAHMSRELGWDFEILERDARGELVPSRPREEHVVIRFIDPLGRNERVIGYDVFNDAIRRAAIERARDLGEPVASERIEFVQDPEGGFGFLFFMPVYETDITPASVQSRRETIRGFAVAAIRIGALARTSFADVPSSGIMLTLSDEDAPPERRFLGTFPRIENALETPRTSVSSGRLEVVRFHEIGGRTWSLRYQPTPDAVLVADHGHGWPVLATGLALTGLLGAFLLVVTGREVLESERLKEVDEINTRLELTNEELARFAYAASHDLRAPLRGVRRLVEFLIEDHGEDLADDARKSIGMIESRIVRMDTLLEDLLQFSRVGWLQQEPENVNLSEVVAEIVEITPDSERFEVRAHDLPEFPTFRVPLTQVLRNLIGNAIKHHDRGSGCIDVTCTEDGSVYTISVRDDGPGVAVEDHERIFEMFQSLSPREDHEGSGMGLALVRKIVMNRGGEVRIDSPGTRGTTISFTWPQ